MFFFQLHIPNCTGITPEGVLEAVKKLKHHNGRLRDLKINGIRSINQEHLETLLSLFEINQTVQKEEKCFYPPDYKHLNLRGDQETKECSIDVEICPRCLRGGMVFDCPRLINCNQRRRRRFIFSFNQWRECRGCYGCIRRCEGCGNCVMHGDARGAACGDHIVCNVCWVHSPKCNICNKAYCNQHTDTQCTFPAGSSGFACHNCLAHSSNIDFVNPQALGIQGPEFASSSHSSPQMEFCS